MAIKDGYAILAFDYNVDTADDNCLLNMGTTAGSQKAKKEVRMIDKLLKMTKGKSQINKYKGMLEGLKKNLLTNISKGLLEDDVEIPALPFKVPSFNIAGIKIDLNDKERINEHFGKVKDVVKSDAVQGILKAVGLNIGSPY